MEQYTKQKDRVMQAMSSEQLVALKTERQERLTKLRKRRVKTVRGEPVWVVRLGEHWRVEPAWEQTTPNPLKRNACLSAAAGGVKFKPDLLFGCDVVQVETTRREQGKESFYTGTLCYVLATVRA